MVYKAVKKDTGGGLCSDVNKCTVNVSVPMIVGWVKTTCMCYNAVTGSTPSYLSELLHLYSPSRSLRSSSDTRVLKLQRFNCKTHGFHTFSHFGPHIWNNLPQYIMLLYFQKQTGNIYLSRIFQLSNIVLHPHQFVQGVCVWILHMVILEPMLMSTLCC